MSNFVNKYDNADFSGERSAKDIAAAYNSSAEMKALKEYYELIILEAKVQASAATVDSQVMDANGKMTTVKIPIKDLVMPIAPFEHARRRVILKLNDLTKTAAGIAELKTLYAAFNTESLDTLSSELTNVVIDESRKSGIRTKFDLYTGNP
jgi:hypothetical protein